MAKQEEKTFSFQVDESSDVPLWVQLKNRLSYLITSGFYEPGEQLPTVRALASEISINYNTVNKAYLALKSEGYIESTRGRGAFVRNLDEEIDVELSREVDTVLSECVASCRGLGMTLDDVQLCMGVKIAQMKRLEGEEANRQSAESSPNVRIVTIELSDVLQRKQA